MSAIKNTAIVLGSLAILVVFGHILVVGVVVILMLYACLALVGMILRLPTTIADRWDRHYRIGAYAGRR